MKAALSRKPETCPLRTFSFSLPTACTLNRPFSASCSGDSPHADIVVIRFPSAAAASGWFASPAYQALIPLREQAAEVLLLAYED